jgi:hypothetical protein
MPHTCDVILYTQCQQHTAPSSITAYLKPPTLVSPAIHGCTFNNALTCPPCLLPPPLTSPIHPTLRS